MIILGLTGSIGMGKSTTALFFRQAGVPVHDADAAVHQLFARGGAAVGPLEAAFPGVVVEGAVDRQRLSGHVIGKPTALSKLEKIVHPLVRHHRLTYLARAARRGVPWVVLDIPLLFETGGEADCDAVAVVTAPAFIQRQRVLNRPGMTEEKFAAILQRQLPDQQKRRRADFLIWSSLGRQFARASVESILQKVRHLPARHWPPKPPR
ncbi:MAG: dephospho-CoA kinase [Magnetospiraceae bacterium]